MHSAEFSRRNFGSHFFTAMKFTVSPVVKVAVMPKDGKDLPQLVNDLKKLSQDDSIVPTRVQCLEHVRRSVMMTLRRERECSDEK